MHTARLSCPAATQRVNPKEGHTAPRHGHTAINGHMHRSMLIYCVMPRPVALLCKECTLLVRIQLSEKNANHIDCAFADCKSTTMCGAMISLTPCIASTIPRECDFQESMEFQDVNDMIRQLNGLLAKPVGFPQIPDPRKDCHLFQTKPGERHQQHVLCPEQDCECLVYMSDQNTSMVEALGIQEHPLWPAKDPGIS